MPTPIYLDYAATTPVDPAVAEVMIQCLTRDGTFANAASRSHIYGWQAEERVEDARALVADVLNADPREIVWTSGATESNNLAIKGLLAAHAGRPCHIVTSLIEHKAVLDPCGFLESQGVRVTRLQPDRDGVIHPAQVQDALCPDTVLVSLMHVNNELGVVTDIGAIGAICRQRGVVFHVDAAQSAGKLAIDVRALQVDLLSLSAHKIYGPKGAGALFVRRAPELRIESQIHGGGHERGMRSGTLATHQIVGLGEALRLAEATRTGEQAKIVALRERFWAGIEPLGGIGINGTLQAHIAGILNVSFDGVDGEKLLLHMRQLAVSSGSACTSASLEPSYVLKATGLEDHLAHASVRFSFGRYTTQDEVDQAVDVVRETVTRLRQNSARTATV